MKSALLSFIFLSFSLFGYSQIVISEIMYNPPESGTDSLEYIEISNAGLVGVDISGYHFLQGVKDTVAMGTMLPAGAAYVFSENATALSMVLGASSDQWTDGALSNQGETIELADASGISIDSVAYDNGSGWPVEADGTDGAGGSIELCDLLSDNNESTNWAVSGTDTGIEINGNNISATPGMANTAMCAVMPDHTVDATPNNVFTPADITINVGEVVAWTNVGGNHNVNGSLASYPDNPEGFDNGAASTDAWTYAHSFTLAGVYDYQCDPHVGLGMVGTVTVIDPNAPNYPEYSIGVVTSIDADGVADSIGVSCSVSGIVHGINFRQSGFQFTLIDSDDNGIGVFSPLDDFGYTVMEGDVLTMSGVIEQFDGLTVIVPVDVEVVGTDDLMTANWVSSLDESTESQLVKVSGFFNEADWVDDGSSFNFEITDDTGQSVTIRIDSETDIAGTNFIAVCTYMTVTGIGGQLDVDSPFDSGYRLFPRYLTDIDCSTSTNDLLQAGNISLSPNPTAGMIHITTEQNLERLEITNVMGQSILKQNYTPSLDVSALVKGMYIITFYKEDRSHTIKFVKE